MTGVRASILLMLALLFCTPPSIHAHFQLDLNIRTIHVVHTRSGLDVYMRLPTSLFLAGLVGEMGEDGAPEPAPFTWNRIESGTLLHYLDLDAIRDQPLAFASIAAQGQVFSVDGKILMADIVDIGIHPGSEQPPFSSLEEARRALREEVIFPYHDPEIYVGETVTDLLLRYHHDRSIDTYTYQSTLNPGLEGQEDTANLLLDYFPGKTRVHRLTGLLNEPVVIRNSEWAAISTFILQGIVHILKGLDHVLFVLCLTLGTAGLVGLLWRITGFTLGHTATLILGFFGFVPQGAWFIPAVETAIAVTIIYAAALALLANRHSSDSVITYTVTTGIGLIHGFGFSFVLHELLLPGGAHLGKSLIAFNVGVEIGQLVIVIAVWGLMIGIARMSGSGAALLRWAVALPCIAIATHWTVERAVLLAG